MPEEPVDPLDSCCMTHDQCYSTCRKKFPCEKIKRKQCMRSCDRDLAYCSSNTGHKYFSPLWWWMRFGTPDPGDNSSNCLYQ
jgi:hypothetical protein